ncbi:MAG: hypothetical protein ABSF17_15490 [Terracidiphilus sp.]
MTASQNHFSDSLHAKLRALPLMTIVCLLLLALLTVVQVAHVHSVETAADHCPLCIAMHSAAPVAVTAAVVILVPMERPAPELSAPNITRHWHPQLFTRPPPESFQG